LAALILRHPGIAACSTRRINNTIQQPSIAARTAPHQYNDTQHAPSPTFDPAPQHLPPFQHTASVTTSKSDVLDTLVNTNEQLTETNAELTAAVAKLNSQNHQLQRQINAANNRLAQHDISRPKFNSAHQRQQNPMNVHLPINPNDNLGRLALLK